MTPHVHAQFARADGDVHMYCFGYSALGLSVALSGKCTSSSLKNSWAGNQRPYHTCSGRNPSISDDLNRISKFRLFSPSIWVSPKSVHRTSLSDQITTPGKKFLVHTIAPIRTKVKPRGSKSNSWLTPEAVAAKRKRRRLERKWLASRDDSVRMEFRHACRDANKKIIIIIIIIIHAFVTRHFMNPYQQRAQ